MNKYLIGVTGGLIVGLIIGLSLQPKSTDAPIKVDTPTAVTQPTKPYTSFSDGIYEVNVDIKPGVYKTDGTATCYYARLSSLNGGDNIIDNNNTSGPVVVEILSTDRAFETKRCGTWQLAG